MLEESIHIYSLAEMKLLHTIEGIPGNVDGTHSDLVRACLHSHALCHSHIFAPRAVAQINQSSKTVVQKRILIRLCSTPFFLPARCLRAAWAETANGRVSKSPRLSV